MHAKRLTCILVGPALLLLSVLTLSSTLTTPGAQAVGVSLWMIFWWISRPVDITVTALIPAIANAFLNIVPMSEVISQYSCESIILIVGSGLITLPWAAIGLDRRIALKVLSLVGPSMRSQITVWLLASTLLTTCLPNVAVCAMFTPIAVSMLKAAGYDNISDCAAAVPILLAIGWGVSLGGAGTPLGGAMNLTAISFLEEYTGKEFMYVDWVIRIAPYFIIAILVLLGCMLLLPVKVKSLEGTKEYFKSSYAELGPMKPIEKVCAALFLIAMLCAFTRPLYAALLPGMVPAYAFLTIGFLCFFITLRDKGASAHVGDRTEGDHVGDDDPLCQRPGHGQAAQWLRCKRLSGRTGLRPESGRRISHRCGSGCVYPGHRRDDEWHNGGGCCLPHCLWCNREARAEPGSLLVYHDHGL